MAITIRDVADAAGVSTATVSRALRGLPNVDERTRGRIQQVAAELDYVISPSASRLASGRTGAIAVVTPYVARWFFSTVLSGVEDVLQEADMDLLLTCIGDHNTPSNRSPVAPRLRRRVDGVLVIAVPPADPQLRELLDLDMPTSMIGLTVHGVPSVTIDDVAAARLATQHLINLGHTRIGIIGGSPSEAPFTAEFDREAGFAKAMSEAGLEVDPMLESYGYFTIEGGESAMTALLTQPKPPTAVFALSDEMAFGALRALRAHGRQPGRDVSVVGVDGHDMSEHLDLTTVVQPVTELGRIAAEALLAQMRGGEPSTDPIRVPTKLVVRGSTGPARD
ncbi:MAG TPA: LacI family DNA-binding transcriptional regulator [Candidatus Nanopelagicales bacterium]|nr:LacI family DNA-binding transcriptional regulator [Candidatus Nanopelagicales bacterium]